MREFSPKSFKHRRTIELCLVGFLACFLSYSYLEKYWVPEVPLAPEVSSWQRPPVLTFDDDVDTGFYVDMDGKWQGVLNGIEVDLTSAAEDGSYRETAIYISGDWDCYLMIDDECVIEP